MGIWFNEMMAFSIAIFFAVLSYSLALAVKQLKREGNDCYRLGGMILTGLMFVPVHSLSWAMGNLMPSSYVVISLFEFVCMVVLLIITLPYRH